MAKRELNLNNDETKNEKVEKIGDKKETKSKKKLIIGVVAGCSKLRVRKTPSFKGDILDTLDKDTRVEILDDKNPTFYKIKGGYCSKEYIKIVESGE